MNKKSLKSLSNVAPKTLATLLVAMALNSCAGTTEHQLSQMTPSEREDFEMYGIVLDDIKISKADSTTGWLVFDGSILGVLGVNALVESIEKKKKQR